MASGTSASAKGAATAAGVGFGGRPDLAGRFAEVALIVPRRRQLELERSRLASAERELIEQRERAEPTRNDSGRRWHILPGLHR